MQINQTRIHTPFVLRLLLLTQSEKLSVMGDALVSVAPTHVLARQRPNQMADFQAIEEQRSILSTHSVLPQPVSWPSRIYEA